MSSSAFEKTYGKILNRYLSKIDGDPDLSRSEQRKMLVNSKVEGRTFNMLLGTVLRKFNVILRLKNVRE